MIVLNVQGGLVFSQLRLIGLDVTKTLAKSCAKLLGMRLIRPSASTQACFVDPDAKDDAVAFP